MRRKNNPQTLQAGVVVDVIAPAGDRAGMRKTALATLAFALVSAGLVSGCTTNGQTAATAPTSAAATAAPTASADHAAAQRGQAFAQSHCSSCHAIGNGISPNPTSPSFARVINTPGLTSGTLNSWLKNSHNFPEMMNFAIEDEHIDDLAAYMLTLRDPNYRPPVH